MFRDRSALRVAASPFNHHRRLIGGLEMPF
jgi:hypothetical protein